MTRIHPCALLLWVVWCFPPKIDTLSICENFRNGIPVQQLKANVPKFKENAGTFHPVPDANGSVQLCISACCKDEYCHVAFLFSGEECYRISCLNKDSCSPIISESSKHSKSIYMLIRDVPNKMTVVDDVYDKPEKTTNSNINYMQNICNLDAKTCPDNEHCQINGNNQTGVCICIDGLKRDKVSHLCEIDINGDSLSTKVPKNHLNITVEGEKTVNLPINELEFIAKPLNLPKNVTDLIYYWEVLKGEGLAYVNSYTSSSMHLTKLRPGVLNFRVTVSNDQYTGNAEFELKVLEEQKPNKKPMAIIRPASPVHGTTGTQLLLDAQGSSDEDGEIVSFSWKLLRGPSVELPPMNTAILALENLVAGLYIFELKVTDDQGQNTVEKVEVIIEEARDDPPKAVVGKCGEKDAGSITLRLPIEALYLCGNNSQDDKEIVHYNWYRVDKLVNQLPIDQTGSNTPFLTLQRLESNEKFGPYEFRLEVVDSKGQKDSVTISIFVNKAENQMPIPNAGPDQTVELPVTSTVLEGNVKDDGRVVGYSWLQLGGPNKASIVNEDRNKATIGNLVEGVYQFQLNVTDDGGLSAVDQVAIKVVRSKNTLPVAKTTNVQVLLPRSVAIFNATLSTDDAGIVSYRWTPDDDVPACLSPVNNVMNEPILLLTELIAGEFSLNLTVTDHSGAQDSTAVKLTVLSSLAQNHSVELYMSWKAADFTYRLRNKLKLRLSSSLSSHIVDVDSVQVNLTKIQVCPKSGLIHLVFYAFSDNGQVIEAKKAVNILNMDTNMLDEFRIESLDTLYCFSDCSEHGVCNDFTKECKCNKYWMPNLFYGYILRKKMNNCDWSILYFSIVSILILVLSACLWAMCLKKRPKKLSHHVKNRPKKRRRYRLMDDSDSSPRISTRKMQLKNNNDKLNTALLISTDSPQSDSENEETIFNRDEVKKRHLRNDGQELIS